MSYTTGLTINGQNYQIKLSDSNILFINGINVTDSDFDNFKADIPNERIIENNTGEILIDNLGYVSSYFLWLIDKYC